MGDFVEIKVPAKYAARLGQCFSTTRYISSARPALRTVEDVERNGYCFTDGVGQISPVLAHMIAHELKLPAHDVPSAFQFRMGGCKGVLVVWPKVKGHDIWTRKSQQKFKAAFNGLEVIRHSQLSRASLNRQTITILSALGVPDEVFDRKLLEQIDHFERAMDDEETAVQMLGRYLDESHTTVTMAAMVSNGFMAAQEPFMMSLLHLWRSWSVKLLKDKAKIVIEDGAFALGVSDETGILRGHQSEQQEGVHDVDSLPEIFLQISDTSRSRKSIIIEGVCIIGRNPSLHPGDIRVVRAVNVAELHHLRDVVVFSQKGDRDVPSMCSGGDLDGDDYFVIWDKDLIPEVWNSRPLEYGAPEPVRVDGQVQVKDLAQFFVLFMKNDSLPTIAHAHLAFSDWLREGVWEKRCKCDGD
jgi:RNA-dependent RNA polymerase